MEGLCAARRLESGSARDVFEPATGRMICLPNTGVRAVETDLFSHFE